MASHLADTSSERKWATGWILPLLAALSLGIFGGLGVFTFGYGEGYAYLGNDPQSCANCHVMQESYDSWLKSSHHAVAGCNDCHTPHDNLLAKYWTKADNGFFHSLAFTTGEFKDPIQIKERNSNVVQAACLHCHTDLVNHMLPVEKGGDMLSCVHCHQSVGHAQSVAPRRYEGY
ncbi:cytochrome c nitrite reductase small subunit [Bythopirellula goksoeyrii]|uniref:Cytochrome c-type protein NrfH n=1 Tax=Bythopirellula goksoeyrii TaxID=1400387 RepID=A0A5B9QIP3_9BACT|nr:cytochrome c nitrite reductase small subunit [Bythopirellula goksoeyrii]QEG37572.1 Cytochrome c-type protein NrfH [Bythopirellula goksoeyrii]